MKPPRKLLEDLCTTGGTTVEMVMSGSRKRKDTAVRRACARLLRYDRGWTFTRIGKFLNISTFSVYHYFPKNVSSSNVAAYIERDERYSLTEDFSELEKKLASEDGVWTLLSPSGTSYRLDS